MASEIRVNQIQNRSGLGTVTFSDAGLSVSGILTATTFSGNLTGNVTGTVSSSGIATFSNGIIVAAGTTAAPSISPSGDSNTGIFFPSADTIAFGEGGAEVLRVDSNGRVGVNTTNPDTTLEVFNGTLKVASTDALNRSLTIDPGSNATYESRIDASHSLVFRSYVAAGAGVKTCTFNTNGDLDLTEGRNLIFASGRGIDFSASSNAAGMTGELLSDYEEGTWTPSITDGYTRTYANRQGRYIKIGSLVYVFGQISGNGRSGAAGSYAYIALPYGANLMGQIQQPLTIMQTYNITHTSLITGAAQWDAPTELRIYETTTNANSNYLSPSNIPASFELGFFYVYYTTS